MQLTVDMLVVDDHPTIIEGYKSILSLHKDKYAIHLTVAYNCEQGYELISKHSFDIILLDIILPPFIVEKIYSGVDLALLIRKISNKSKVMIVTSQTDYLTIYHLVRTINPECLLIKSDLTPDEFLLAFQSLLNGGRYYSVTVKKCIAELGKKDMYLDAINRKIIILLSRGVKTKSLPTHLNLSISAIDKRKSQIKIFFGIDKGNDESILHEAKKRGLI